MIDLHHAQDIAIAAAKLAGERIVRGYTEELDVSVKTDRADVLTQVDTDAQALIEQRLRDAFPDHAFMGEEDEPDSQHAVEREYRWVVYPVDGTSNFTRRLPHVGVSIALQHKGESVLGILYFPVYDHLYSAIRGEGAFRNGTAITIDPCDAMEDAYIAEIFSDRVHRGSAVNFPPCTAYRKFGSAVTSLAYLAEGSIHGTALRCCLWDIAAAAVIVTEAGGRIEWEYDEEGDERGVLTCVAAVPGIFDDMKKFVKTVY